MDKFFKIAAILTATDQMSSVFASAANKSNQSMLQMQQQMKAMRNGALLIGAGRKGLELIGETTKSWGDLQDASLNAQAALMKKGGILDEETFSRVFSMSEKLSEKYANSTAAYLNMVRVLKSNKINEKDILGGIGESTAKLADLFDQMDPAVIGEFAARMKNDMGVPVNDMGRMMDVIARAKNVGVGKTGTETVNEMNEYFSKVGLGLANLKVGGVETGADMAALGAIFMRRGISGQMVGTNFRRILDGLRDPERSGKANAVAGQYGRTLDFFDKAGNFGGVENFVKQLNKLQGLKPDVIAAVLKPFSGRQGLSTDFLEYLANDGLAAFDDIKKSMYEQATLDEKLSKIMEGLNYQKKVFDSSWDNTKAAMGEALSSVMTNFYRVLNEIAVSLREFIQEHPRLSRMIMTFAGLASVALIVAGFAISLKAMAGGMALLGVSTTGTLAALGALAAPLAVIALIISNLDLGIVRINDHLYTLGEIVWNIIKPIEYLLGLIEEIVYRIPKALFTWDKSELFNNKEWAHIGEVNERYKNYEPSQPVPVNSAGAGSITYSPNITFHGTDSNTKAQLQKVLADNQREFDRKMKEYDAQKSRKSF